MRVYLHSIACLVAFFVMVAARGQSRPFQVLENQVYAYNNRLDYKKSQALLLPMLANPAFTTDEHYQAALLLSYTYKRLGDYISTLQYLETAGQLAANTVHPDSNAAQIRVQQALAYFDIHSYAKSARLMQTLEQTHFRYIDRENRGKLRHQQGYLLFLAKRYPEAQTTYDQAMTDLQASSPCDMPMILVKKMQLYAAMNDMDRALAALQASNRYADSCGIIKYRMYAYEELKSIYESRNDLVGLAQTVAHLDTLNLVYAQARHIAELHNQRETMERQQHSRQLATEQTWRSYILIGVIGLLLLATILIVVLYRTRQPPPEQELLQVTADRKAIADPASTHPAPQLRLNAADQPRSALPVRFGFDDLSERQREVFDGIVAGLSNKEIADKLFVSENTVKYHVKNIYLLLEVKDRVDLLVNLSAR